MKRPASIAFLFLVSGIVLGRSIDGFVILFLFACLLGLCICICLKYKYIPSLLFILFALLGYIRLGHSMRQLPYIEGAPISISGPVIDIGETSTGNQKITIKVNKIRLLVYLQPGDYAMLGQNVTVTGVPMELDMARNPGAYNEFMFLRSRKIDGKMFADSFAAGERTNILPVFLNNISLRLASVFDTVLPDKESAIIKSIVLGDRAGLEEDDKEMYRMAGIYHLLSISGLHISIIMMALSKLLKAWLNERRAGIIVLGVLVFYCLLTGASIPTVRAVTMCAVVILGRILYRERDLLSSIAFAGILLLVYEPLYIFDAGFQLSFGAVTGIALLTTPFVRLFSLIKIPFNDSVKNMLAANCAATFATYPIISYHFYTISTYSIFVNMIIIPTASILVVFGLLTALTGLVFIPAAIFISGVIYYLLRFYDKVCNFFIDLPLSQLRTGSCGLLVLSASFCVLAGFIYMMSGFGHAFKIRIYIFAGSLLLLIACILIRINPSGVRLAVLDGGRDSYSVIRYGRHAIVFGEAGDRERVLDDYLSYLGVKSNNIINVMHVLNEGGNISIRDLSISLTGPFYYVNIGDALFCFIFEAYDISSHRSDVDVIILGPGAMGQPDYYQGAIYVLSGGPFWMQNAATSTLEARGIEYYSTQEHGAQIYDTNGKRILIRN